MSSKLSEKTQKMTRKKLLALILTPLLLVGGFIGSFAIGQTASANTPAANHFISSVNSYRSAQGLQPMSLNDSMSANAQAWAEYMAANDYYEHNPNYTVGSPAGSRIFAENIAAGFGAEFYISAPNLWYNSPSHYANMMNPQINLMGAGFAVGPSGRAYAVQQFASYNYTPPAPPAQPSTPAVNSNGDGTATVSWSYPNQGSTPVTSAVITHSVNSAHSNSYTVGAETSITVPVQPGSSNSFSVTAKSSSGTSTASAQATLNEPAVQPSGVTVNNIFVGSRTATIQASVESDGGSPVTNYTLSMNGELYESADGIFTIENLTRNATHSGVVTAHNSAGASSPFTAELFTTNAETSSTVRNLTVSIPSGTSTITAAWASPADNGGDTQIVYSYKILGVNGETLAEESTAEPSVKFEGKKGASYVLSVTSDNKAGKSEAVTANINIPTTVPSTVPAPTAVLTGEKDIVVAWVAPTDNGGTEVVNYTVHGYADGEREPSLTAKLPSNATSAYFSEVDGVNFNKSYRFSVNSENAAGVSLFSDYSVEVKTPEESKTEEEEQELEEELEAPKNLAPSKVENLTLVDSSSETENGVTASWVNSDESVIAFKVDVHSEAGDSVFSTSVDASTTETYISELDPATAYSVSVSAVNEHGVGEPVVSSVVTGVKAPSEPENIQASPQIIDGAPALTVTWNTPSSTGGANIADYTVTLTNSKTGEVIPQKIAGDNSATFRGLSPVTEYVVEVSASNGTYVGSSASSSALTSTSLPAAPSPVKVDVDSSGVVTVEWAEPADGSLDQSVGIEKYVVSLLTESLTLISPPAGFNVVDWFLGLFTDKEAAPVETVETSVKWEGVKPGSYFVRVVAVNNQGIEGKTSEQAFTVAEPAPAEEEETAEPDKDEPVKGEPAEEESAEPEDKPTVTATAPGKPAAVNVVAELSSEAVVSWEEPETDGGSPVVSYVVTQKFNNSETVRVFDSSVLSSKYSSLLPGATYSFSVVAVNKIGESEPVEVSHTAKKISTIVSPPEEEVVEEQPVTDSKAPGSPEMVMTSEEPTVGAPASADTRSEPAVEEPAVPADEIATSEESSDNVESSSAEEAHDASEDKKRIYTPAPSEEHIASLKQQTESSSDKPFGSLMLIVLGLGGAVVLGGAGTLVVSRLKK